MKQSPPSAHVLTVVNAVSLTIARNLHSGAPRWAGYRPEIAKVFLYLPRLARAPARMPMKIEL
jgi:hypothetical protein